MEYTFQKATRRDIPEILEIADSHYYTFGPSGFLVSKYTYEIISGKIHNPNSQIFVTKNQDGEVVGWIILSKIFHTETMNGLTLDRFKFKNEEDKKLLTSRKHWHMEQGAVRKDMLHKGVGSFYYQSMFDMFSDHTFSSNVITKPVYNRASVKIKGKYGFREAGIFEAEEHKEIKNMQMTLFIREPK
ncbi:GNAT family N-acetyltransferase [Priestia filamentosa]|uniref:GNAT family N-acetyltransferase n=1 Tax=Priestia filamentosa TaxID=1402861 RepID=UPI0005895487